MRHHASQLRAPLTSHGLRGESIFICPRSLHSVPPPLLHVQLVRFRSSLSISRKVPTCLSPCVRVSYCRHLLIDLIFHFAAKYVGTCVGELYVTDQKLIHWFRHVCLGALLMSRDEPRDANIYSLLCT